DNNQGARRPGACLFWSRIAGLRGATCPFVRSLGIVSSYYYYYYYYYYTEINSMWTDGRTDGRANKQCANQAAEKRATTRHH
ncbi:MAG: hypothetical protein N6V49_12450, partial [Serratia symbiotica]|nr:hypothetical protein [Serratia symbiotica]